MWRFALANLFRRPLRTALALVGLAVGVVGIVGLVSFSQGMRASMQEAAERVPGVLVLAKDAPTPVVSNLPGRVEADLRAIQGVRAVIPEIWFPVLSLEDHELFRNGPLPLAIVGMDPVKRATLRGGGLYVQSLKEGRFLEAVGEEDVVISRAVADRFHKRIGDSLTVLGRSLTIVGIYATGADLLDNLIIVQEGVAREAAGKAPDTWSCFYVEAEDPLEASSVARRIDHVVPGVVARTLTDWSDTVGGLLTDLDVFLSIVASTALAVGAIGILNTMLMSVTERSREFGILRATGWRVADVVGLVLRESAVLGTLGGILGCALALAALAAAGHLLPLTPVTPAWLLGGALLFSTVLGALGGLYPAFRAARLDPVAALRSL